MDLTELFNSDKVLMFWPSQNQSAKERVYATTRFILYLSCILYIIRRDVRIIIMGTALIAILYVMYKNGMIKEGSSKYAAGTTGTVTNPMANAEYGQEMTQTMDPVDSKNAWDSLHPFQEGRWFAESNFYTVPRNSGEEFLKKTYPAMFKPVCRDTDGSACDLDSSQGRGPEMVQSHGARYRSQQ